MPGGAVARPPHPAKAGSAPSIAQPSSDSGFSSTATDQSGQIYGIFKNQEHPNAIDEKNSCDLSKCLYVGKTIQKSVGDRFIQHVKEDGDKPWHLSKADYGNDDAKWPYVPRQFWGFNGITKFDVAVAEQYYLQEAKSKKAPLLNDVNAITPEKFALYKDDDDVFTTKKQYKGGMKVVDWKKL